MKLIALWLILPLQGMAQTASEDIIKLLFKNEQALMDGVATGDKKVWSKFLHDSCIISLENGQVISRQKMIEELNPLPAGYMGRIKIIDPRCRIYGNTAVITFIDDEYLELYNQKIHTQYRQTDTWIKVDDHWKIVAMQIFEIPKPPVPVVINEAILKNYPGTYELSAEKRCQVYVENGRLFSKKNNREAEELLAETENVFFRKGDGRVNVIFMKANDGTYKMIERREGEDLVWRKSN